ncbi:MAG TPA: hypothetical protein VG165_10230 [Solirubrobacteraceae bacterium]|jgi:hypothetical protein|nr:hypothetical protein [Solirubrobacteraceae bacterium]
MPVRVRFQCQFCNAAPDRVTQLSLESQLRELVFGEYLDAPPANWLVWHGGGPLGPRRYACFDHRGDLTAFLRNHYGTIGSQVWKVGPYPMTRRSSDTELAVSKGGLSPMPKWAFGPKIG